MDSGFTKEIFNNSLINRKLTDRPINSQLDLDNAIREMEVLTFKNDFNSKVIEYKEIVYRYIYEESFTYRRYNSSHDTMGIIQLVDYWVTVMESTIWNYSEAPFEFKNNADLSNLPDGSPIPAAVNDFYKGMADKMTKFFASADFNFKTAFSNIIRDWFELGMGVMRLVRNGNHIWLNTVPPEKVSFTKNTRGQINNIVIMNDDIRLQTDGYNEVSAKAYEIYSLVDVNNKNYNSKWEFKDLIITSQNKVIINSHETYNYQPIFITMSNVRTGCKVGYGKGLEVLPLVKVANNILQSLKEVGDKELFPTTVIPAGSMRMDSRGVSTERNILQKLTKTSVVMSEGNMAGNPYQLPIMRNPQVAQGQLQFYIQRIQDSLSPNKMILAKGRARMTAEEVRMRDSYDKGEITSMTASLVDELLMPLIKDVFRHIYYTFKKELAPLANAVIAGVTNTLQSGQSAPQIDMFDYKVELKNVMGDKQIEDRLSVIQQYISLIGAVAQLKQAGIPNADVLMKELGTLLDVSGSSEEDMSNVFNSTAARLAQQTGDNIKQANTTT